MQPFFICSISDSMDTSAMYDDSMPRLEIQLFAIQAILENYLFSCEFGLCTSLRR